MIYYDKQRIAIEEKYYKCCKSSHRRIGNKLRRKLTSTFPRGKHRILWDRMYKNYQNKKMELIFRKQGL